MTTHYHILNGDALKERFPAPLDGERIVVRECLVDGPVDGNTLSQLYATRAQFLNTHYGNTSLEAYQKKVASEFEKIQHISKAAQINLWFEDDLFCQVHFWFVIWLLKDAGNQNPIFLVRPNTHTRFGFGGYDKAGLQQLFTERIEITERDAIASLWEHYQKDHRIHLIKTAQDLSHSYPFILKAVEAHIDRIPSEKSLGRPTETLQQIIKDLKTDNFGLVFQEFCKREVIYGYGDLQVKRLYDELMNEHQ